MLFAFSQDKKSREKVFYMSEYNIQAENFLKKTNTTFKAEFVKFDKYFDDDKQEEYF